MSKNNQIKNKMIQTHPKTDRARLGGLETFLHKAFEGCSVTLEPHMMFTKGEDEYVGMGLDLTLGQVRRHNTYAPDAVFHFQNVQIILELDGPIHDIKTMKTEKRNKLYELNKINYVVVNESELRDKLRIPKSRPLTQEQINKAFYTKITKCLLRCGIYPYRYRRPRS